MCVDNCEEYSLHVHAVSVYVDASMPTIAAPDSSPYLMVIIS